MPLQPTRPTSRSLLERGLALATDIRPGEAPTALLLTLNVFLVLMSYYLIKPVREALILDADSGPQIKSYASALTAVLLLFALPLYSRIADRLPHHRLVVFVTLFFAANLGLFYAGYQTSAQSSLGVPFYLWVGIFNMMVIAQFWAFANDIYSEERGKRLFPVVGIGASLGAAVGSKVVVWLLEILTVDQLLLVAAVTLVACAGLTQIIHRTQAASPSSNPAAPDSEPSPPKPQDKAGGFSLVLRHPYLRYIAIFTLVFTFANTNGEYVVSVLVSEGADQAVADGTTTLGRKEWIGAFYGDFYFYVNVLGLLLQTFVVSRMVKWGGLRLALYALPVIVVATWSIALVFPILAIVRWSKTIENATDYSVNNTARHMLWLPTTADMKYKAQQVVDAFCVRMGDVSSALTVFVATTWLGWGVRGFATLNLALAAVWIVLAARIVREQARM